MRIEVNIDGTITEHEDAPIIEIPEEERLKQEQINFRIQRNNLLKEADIEINKLDDNSQDSSKWRIYRQALRDATISWELPAKPEGDN